MAESCVLNHVVIMMLLKETLNDSSKHYVRLYFYTLSRVILYSSVTVVLLELGNGGVDSLVMVALSLLSDDGTAKAGYR